MGSNKELLQEMFAGVFGNPGFDEALVRRYFSPDYRQSVDGKQLDFAGFLSHLRALKGATRRIAVRFKTIAEDGVVVFTNHEVTAETKEGRTAQMQVIAEFRLSQGRIVSCDELTHMIEGDSRDRDLGSRRETPHP